jgi:hypothetical protein
MSLLLYRSVRNDSKNEVGACARYRALIDVRAKAHGHLVRRPTTCSAHPLLLLSSSPLFCSSTCGPMRL